MSTRVSIIKCPMCAERILGVVTTLPPLAPDLPKRIHLDVRHVCITERSD